jgi:hypothetical protein
VKQYLRRVGTEVQIDSSHDCVVFTKDTDPAAVDSRIAGLCGGRTQVRWNPKAPERQDLLLHIPMKENIRWLAHFYAFIVFPDEHFDRYVKRFIRDNMHYRGDIFCHAAAIVRVTPPSHSLEPANCDYTA